MGARGPKKGFKLARTEGAAMPLLSIQHEPVQSPIEGAGSPTPVVLALAVVLAASPSAPAAPPAPTADASPAVPSHWRDNPQKLEGAPLRKLANSWGMSNSELDRMTDDKIRAQLKYIEYRRAAGD